MSGVYLVSCLFLLSFLNIVTTEDSSIEEDSFKRSFITKALSDGKQNRALEESKYLLKKAVSNTKRAWKDLTNKINNSSLIKKTDTWKHAIIQKIFGMKAAVNPNDGNKEKYDKALVIVKAALVKATRESKKDLTKNIDQRTQDVINELVDSGAMQIGKADQRPVSFRRFTIQSRAPQYKVQKLKKNTVTTQMRKRKVKRKRSSKCRRKRKSSKCKRKRKRKHKRKKKCKCKKNRKKRKKSSKCKRRCKRKQKRKKLKSKYNRKLNRKLQRPQQKPKSKKEIVENKQVKKSKEKTQIKKESITFTDFDLIHGKYSELMKGPQQIFFEQLFDHIKNHNVKVNRQFIESRINQLFPMSDVMKEKLKHILFYLENKHNNKKS